jgi:glycosyltransferase involved in cell wall biosynthesis
MDDGSTDGTRNVLAGFGAQIVFLTQANAGVQAARNLAVSRSTAEWITFCDQEDLWQRTYGRPVCTADGGA